MTSILWAWSLLLLTSSVHLLGFILLSRIWKLPIEEVGIFFGVPLRTVTLKGIRFSLYAIPLPCGFVKFAGGEADLDPKPGTYLALPRLARCLILLSGPLATLGMATALLGPLRADAEFRSGFSQIFSGIVSPSRAREMLLDVDRLVRHVPWWTFLGIAAAKVTAFNVLPIPTLNGGEVILTLLRGRKPEPPWMEKSRIFGLLFLLIFLGATLLALISLRVMGGSGKP